MVGVDLAGATTPTRKRVLVVDDEPDIRSLVVEVLEDDGWETVGASDGTEALEILEKEGFDLVLLDLLLPGIDGFEVLRRARLTRLLPIVGLSAVISSENRERFVRLGGTDYIAKPFTTDELKFRAWAAITKMNRPERGDSSQPDSVGKAGFSDGYLAINVEARRVFVGGAEIALQAREYDLLVEMLKSRGKVLSHEQLLNSVWGPEFVSDVNLLHTSVARLRFKIEPDRNHPRYVTTVHRVGYRFL